MSALPHDVDTQDYQAQMQRAALAFMRRHADEHLGDEQLLQRATLHLTLALEVPLFLAQRLVERAFARLREANRVEVDLSAAPDRDAICLIDCRNGQKIFVQRRILPSAFLARFTTP
ncbi:hypothetical protein [Metapseudomonas otitidis]|uniref:hypothetical protein n=1 Tax=Metapseudomonas otitidis TaxID=319939 RepID=UPI0028113C04|nr:hypothetical protein [Pseudomonas otitidis]WMR35707.1 hypothetical protein QT513_13530 [Pseudomonas otitidis]